MRASLLPITLLFLGSCAHPMKRYARDFVHWDAQSDAANSAAYRCGGDAELIAGQEGLSPDDYRCPTPVPIPSIYVCDMDDGSVVSVSVLTDMSGEVRDGQLTLQLKYPVFQSNHKQVLVSANWPTQPYVYSLSIERLDIVRAHVSPVQPYPILSGRCRRE